VQKKTQVVYLVLFCTVHCLKKNDSDVALYNFNAHQPILTIFGRDIAERYSLQILYQNFANGPD